jgi:hypothetical protein
MKIVNQIHQKNAHLYYVGTEVLAITKLLKKHNINIAFKTKNTTAKHLLYINNNNGKDV